MKTFAALLSLLALAQLPACGDRVVGFPVNDVLGPIAGSVSYVGVVASFDPTLDLASDTTYTARIRGTVGDLAGNPLAQDYVWSFTTGDGPDTTPPLVTATVPASFATSAAVNTSISAVFSEPMDPSTITGANFELMAGTGAVPGTVSYVGVTATFDPTAPLAANASYTATVSTGAADLAIAKVRRPEAHKRLMLLTNFVILTPAFARLFHILIGAVPPDRMLNSTVGAIATDVMILVAIGYDLRTRGRPHPAYLLGGAFIVGVQLVCLDANSSAAWYAVTDWLIRPRGQAASSASCGPGRVGRWHERTTCPSGRLRGWPCFIRFSIRCSLKQRAPGRPSAGLGAVGSGAQRGRTVACQSISSTRAAPDTEALSHGCLARDT